MHATSPPAAAPVQNLPPTALPGSIGAPAYTASGKKRPSGSSRSTKEEPPLKREVAFAKQMTEGFSPLDRRNPQSPPVAVPPSPRGEGLAGGQGPPLRRRALHGTYFCGTRRPGAPFPFAPAEVVRRHADTSPGGGRRLRMASKSPAPVWNRGGARCRYGSCYVTISVPRLRPSDVSFPPADPAGTAALRRVSWQGTSASVGCRPQRCGLSSVRRRFYSDG